MGARRVPLSEHQRSFCPSDIQIAGEGVADNLEGLARKGVPDADGHSFAAKLWGAVSLASGREP